LTIFDIAVGASFVGEARRAVIPQDGRYIGASKEVNVARWDL